METDIRKIMDEVAFCAGRLMGLSGTVRYEMPSELRAEIREVAERLDKLWRTE